MLPGTDTKSRPPGAEASSNCALDRGPSLHYRDDMQPSLDTTLVATALATSGVTHWVRPELFEPLIPRQLGNPRAWVYGSGVAELVCAGGLMTRQPWAPSLTTGTLALIWVGNVQMAVDTQRSARPTWQKVAAWARLPLQLPMMRAAWVGSR